MSDKMNESDLITSALGRFLEVGGLVGRVGFSIAGNAALSLFSDDDSRTQSLAGNYRAFFQAFAADRAGEAPEILKRLGIHYADGRTLDPKPITDFASIMRPVFTEKPYCFGNARPLVRKIMDLKMGKLFDSLQVVFPQDVVFIHRTIAGLFGNLNRIRACGNRGEIARDYIDGGSC